MTRTRFAFQFAACAAVCLTLVACKSKPFNSADGAPPQEQIVPTGDMSLVTVDKPEQFALVAAERGVAVWVAVAKPQYPRLVPVQAEVGVVRVDPATRQVVATIPIDGGAMALKKTGRDGYSYEVESSTDTFRVTATCPAATTPGCTNYSIDQNMTVQAAP